MGNSAMRFRQVGISIAALALASCATSQATSDDVAMAAPQPDQDLGQLFESYDAQQLALSPLSKAYRGIRDEDYSRWGDFSDAAEEREEDLLQSTAATMRANYDPAELSREDALSYRLFDAMAERSAALYPFRDYGYVFDQMRGAQSL